jgi:hypothetical protein
MVPAISHLEVICLWNSTAIARRGLQDVVERWMLCS